MSDSKFRTTTLTLLGAAGYLVSLLLILLKATGMEIPWRVIGYPALTASVLLNIDLAIDVFPFQVRQREDQSDTGQKNDDDTGRKGDTE